MYDDEVVFRPSFSRYMGTALYIGFWPMYGDGVYIIFTLQNPLPRFTPIPPIPARLAPSTQQRGLT